MIKMDKGSEYSLKWNSHKSTVMSAFTCLFENEKHADCTLAAEGRFIKVHQVMMSACSPYLERLLEEHSKDKNSHPIVIFNDLSYFELKALCEYMYKGEVNVPMENLDNFLKIAKVMQVRGLCDGGGGDSIGGLEKGGSAKASPAHHVIDKRKQGPADVKHQMQQQAAKRKRQDGGFDSDASSDNVSYVSSSPRGRGKGAKQSKVIAACSPRVVQEVKPEVIKYEEPETVYEETVCQDLTFEEEIYQDPNNEPGTSNNEPAIDFGGWNDGNSNEYNQEASNQEQDALYSCRMCKKQYARLKSLQSHQRYECGKNPEYQCPHCPYRSKQKGYLNQHVQIKHSSTSRVFVCSKCNYQTKYKSNLNIHLRSVMHNPESTKRYVGNIDSKHLCQSCGRIYSSMSALRLHQSKGCPTTSVHFCPECSFKTNIISSLNRHKMLKHNSNSVVYKCPRCTYMSPTALKLQDHMMKKHNESALLKQVDEETSLMVFSKIDDSVIEISCRTG